MQTFEAALFDELTPIYPDTNPAEGFSSYRVAGANGTYAGVHIVLRGLTPGIPVSVEVQGPHGSYKLFELRALPVEINTGAKQRTEYLKNDVNEHVIRRAPFMIYDVLDPFYNIFQPQFPTAGIAFKTPIEYCRQPRTQTWTLLVTQGDATKKLTLFVDEYPYQVPAAGKDTFQYVNWFSFSQLAQSHRAEKWSPLYLSILEKYLRAAVYSRQNIFCITMEEIFDLDETGKPILNEAHLETMVAVAKRAGITLFHGGAFAVRHCSQADDDAFYASIDHSALESPDEIAEIYKQKAFDAFDYGKEAHVGMTGEIIPGSAGENTLKSMAEQLYTWLAVHDLTDSWTQCCLDEPNEALEEAYRRITSIVRAAMPNIPLLEPTLAGHPLEGTMDIWCPSLDQYEQQLDFYNSRVAAGDKIWVYSCLTPGANYCNRLQDMERLRQVWLGWAPAKYTDIEGFLHWGGNYYHGEGVFRHQAGSFWEKVLEFHPKYAMYLPAGDGAIFFPGHDMPLICTRSEAHRIGLEDLCMLETLRAQCPDEAAALIAKVFRQFNDFEKDVAVYRRVRKELLEAVMALEERK